MFWVDKGEEDGVAVYAAVVSAHGSGGPHSGGARTQRRRHGLDEPGLSRERDARGRLRIRDGGERTRGQFREVDRLVLNGTAYHEDLESGARVLTSGLGRGLSTQRIPIGLIDETAEEQGTWRKSYWMRPSVEPASVTHVLVAGVDARREDLEGLWPGDTTATSDLERGKHGRPGLVSTASAARRMGPGRHPLRSPFCPARRVWDR